jgi:hypothetical protein
MLWLWVALLAGTAGWNIARLSRVRPRFDSLLVALGVGAIVSVVLGASIVVTSMTEPAAPPLVALLDLAACGALITAWLRSDACHAP